MARLAFDRLGQFFRQRRRLTRASDIARGLAQMRDRDGAEQQIDSAILRLTRAADEALDVFKKAGLPSQLGTYAAMTDGSYLPIEVRQTPGSRLTTENAMPDEAMGVLTLSAIGQRNYAPDSPVGFAARVIEIVEDLRDRLRAAAERDRFEEVRSINDALLLREASLALRLEFVEGPDIASSRARRERQQEGGSARGKQIAGAARARHRMWQATADDIWARHPTWEKAKVVRAVAARHSVPVNTIRAVIEKKT
ncbi:MAG: hypothetical protein DCF28_06675 [Alphaproteobacteria bacterium]|nr:MAG: hypothetical protein DCF28_06675 [Alphaproteobacteria bacterium]